MYRQNFTKTGRVERKPLFVGSAYLPASSDRDEVVNLLLKEGYLSVMTPNYELLEFVKVPLNLRASISIPLETAANTDTQAFGSSLLLGSDWVYGNVYVIGVLDNFSTTPSLEDRRVEEKRYFKCVGETITEQFNGPKTLNLLGENGSYNALVSGLLALASNKEISLQVGRFKVAITESAVNITVADDTAGEEGKPKGSITLSADGTVDLLNKGQSLNALLGNINDTNIVPVPMDGGKALLTALVAQIKIYLG